MCVIKSIMKTAKSPVADRTHPTPLLVCTKFGLIIWLFDGECKNVVESTKLPTKLSTDANDSCLMAITVILFAPVVTLIGPLEPPACAADTVIVCDCCCCSCGCWCCGCACACCCIVDAGDACSPLQLPVLLVVTRVKRISDMDTD